jgi:hypothetical protein
VLLENEYHLLILDEAQNIKNPKAQATVIARRIKARGIAYASLGRRWKTIWGDVVTVQFPDAGSARRSTLPSSRTLPHADREASDGERRRAPPGASHPSCCVEAREMVAAELPPKTEILRTVEFGRRARDLYETILNSPCTKSTPGSHCQAAWHAAIS